MNLQWNPAFAEGNAKDSRSFTGARISLFIFLVLMWEILSPDWHFSLTFSFCLESQWLSLGVSGLHGVSKILCAALVRKSYANSTTQPSQICKSWATENANPTMLLPANMPTLLQLWLHKPPWQHCLRRDWFVEPLKDDSCAAVLELP